MNASQEKKGQNQAGELKALPLWGSLVWFGIPTIAMVLSVHVWLPRLENAGLEPLQAFIVAFCVPTALLFAAAMVAFNKVEGRPLTMAAFRQRMRLERLGWKEVLWGLGAFVAGLVGMGLIGAATMPLIEQGIISVPAEMPLLLDPAFEINQESLDALAGGKMAGRWDLLLGYTVTYFFMIAGEELLWRGILLPRQELAHGRFAWLVNGLLWNLFHLFKWWQMPMILPLCLALAYSTTRTKSTWPAVIAHTLGNLSFWVIILLTVVG